MKTPLFLSTVLACSIVTSEAAIETFAEYHLGEQGNVNPPRDSSANGRNFVNTRTDSFLITTDPAEISPEAIASTAFLSGAFLNENGVDINGGFWGGPLGDLPTDNFAIGIFVRAADIT